MTSGMSHSLPRVWAQLESEAMNIANEAAPGARRAGAWFFEFRQKALSQFTLGTPSQPPMDNVQRISALWPCHSLAERIEINEDHRRSVERQNLTDEQSANNGDPERMAQFGTFPRSQYQR
jgi:hypothetical protein